MRERILDAILPVLLILLVSFSGASFAQPYKTVRPDSETYFINQHGIIKGIKIDSASAGGNDSVYYNFNSLRTDTCDGFTYSLTPYGASWIGKRVIIKPDGKNIFLNKNSDTLIIETQAHLNESWALFRFPDGDWIEGSVADTGIITVAGADDSIQIISLQLKDSAGTSLFHSINSKYFAISKWHGLIATPDIYDFPDDTLQYVRTDKKRLTNGDIFNYAVGDERQIKITSGSAFMPLVERYVLDIIIGRRFSVGFDSVFYQMKRKIIEYAYFPDSMGYPSEPDITSAHEDTVQISYAQLDSPVLAWMPEEAIIEDYDLWDYTLQSGNSVYGGRTSMVYGNRGCYFIETDSCWSPVIDGTVYSRIFIEGLGSLESDYSFGGGYSEELIYYRKGQETFGQLFTNIADIPEKNYSISIYPNPLTSTSTLEYTLQQSETLTIRLLDLQGKTVKTFLSNTQKEAGSHRQAITLPASLPAGSYLIVIESEKGTMGVRVTKV